MGLNSTLDKKKLFLRMWVEGLSKRKIARNAESPPSRTQEECLARGTACATHPDQTAGGEGVKKKLLHFSSTHTWQKTKQNKNIWENNFGQTGKKKRKSSCQQEQRIKEKPTFFFRVVRQGWWAGGGFKPTFGERCVYGGLKRCL